ncbi:hypothetical protein [Tanticharoenia sakaeratensis]|uniref:Uncharacterized protein n=1 Tax=Tanticharoenia sakaeratensis NBRC 103193 TaxID=1231623 RepID=A0A0D6MPE0_9PROT|nr:hypothetical protein [Tanticharoenia sakaeratensis]GAN55163.1 hypothetical protein Tasa_039_007 [Tanticharoenia sakaeratensis NBRC 103193]GBQ24937.1 hypothetical protein AA103193_2907 [Tanticharoenia sakaeratensis NBRC 103193]
MFDVTAYGASIPALETFAIFEFALEADDMAARHALARTDGRIVSLGGLVPQWDR